MKKIIFATLVVLSVTSISCTSDAIEESTSANSFSNQHNEMLLTQKPGDTTGGQAGNIPPTPPPFTP